MTVLSDNVVDHAENPSRILSEIYRVLKPGGLVYFTVHFHHPLYSIASGIFQFIRRMGIPFEVGAFADHTFHFTLAEAKSLAREQPFQILSESQDTNWALNIARDTKKRHLGDYLKTVFFKNADYEAILLKKR